VITAELIGTDLIGLTSDFDMRDRDRIKQLPGARHKEGKWTVPLSWGACIQLRGVFGTELAVGEGLANWSIKEYESRIGPNMELRTAVELGQDDPLISNWRTDGKTPKQLRPFQEAGVKFLTTARTAYLCDEMGAGKTAQAASALRYLAELGDSPFPAAVVTKASLLFGTKKEFEEWLPGYKIQVVVGSAAQRRKLLEEPADVYIMTYGTVKAHSRLAPYGPIRLRRCVVCDKSLKDEKQFSQTKCESCKKELNQIAWKTVIVDECHMLQDPKAKQTRAVWSLRTKDTENVFLLTGTPVTDNPGSMWAGLAMLEPEAFSNRGKFIERYVFTRYNPFGGGLNLEGLHPATKEEFFRIIDPMFRRMPKAAVLPFLPKKNYITRYCEMTAKQAKAYNQLKKKDKNSESGESMAELPNGLLIASDPLVRATRLSQLASGMLDFDEAGKLHVIGPSNKVDGVMDLLEDMGEDPLVVFAVSVDLLKLAMAECEKKKISYNYVFGDLTPDQVHKATEDFQGGKVRVIFVSTAKGAEGLTLTRSDTVCFMERPWSLVKSKQSEDRVHRIGSEIHDKINVVDLVAPNTIEEKRIRTLQEKGDRLEEITRDTSFLDWLLADE
jgi:SNF2 family DNA or RNA helicase